MEVELYEPAPFAKTITSSHCQAFQSATKWQGGKKFRIKAVLQRPFNAIITNEAHAYSERSTHLPRSK